MKYILIHLFIFRFASMIAAPGDGSLTIVVKGLRNHTGLMNIALFNNPGGFPDDIDKAYKWDSKSIESDSVVFIFNNLPKGNYAFAILHDENADGKMDKIFPGLPREGFAFSTNFKPKIRPPSFDDVSFQLGEAGMVMRVKLIYYL